MATVDRPSPARPPVVAQRVAPGIHRVERVVASGWCFNMLVVELPAGVLIYSPVWIGEEGFLAVESIGRPTVLVAPNHFHHLSLTRYRERYPDALVCASSDALPGLADRGYQGVHRLDDAAGLLPPGARFLSCEGTKSGEAWLAVPGAGDPLAAGQSGPPGRPRTQGTPPSPGPSLLVCDAFFNVERPVTGVMGFGLRALKTVPGLCIGRTFPWLALRDQASYVAWATRAIEELQPGSLLPSHGEAIHEPTLPDRLASLMKTRLA